MDPFSICSVSESYQILLSTQRQRKNKIFIFVIVFLIYCFLSFFAFFFRSFLFLYIFPIGQAFHFFSFSHPGSSTGNADSFSSNTNSISSSVSHSDPYPNPGPWDPLYSYSENVLSDTLDLEHELYSRIRLLESRLIDRLPPQQHLGEYETLVRNNLTECGNTRYYRSTLSNELFALTVLEYKAKIYDQLLNLSLSEPENRLSLIFRGSSFNFNEGSIRENLLDFIEAKMEASDLTHPNSRHEKILVKETLANHLQENGPRSRVYIEFLFYLRDGAVRF